MKLGRGAAWGLFSGGGPRAGPSASSALWEESLEAWDTDRCRSWYFSQTRPEAPPALEDFLQRERPNPAYVATGNKLRHNRFPDALCGHGD